MANNHQLKDNNSERKFGEGGLKNIIEASEING